MGKIPTTITSPSTPIETDARERTIAMLLAAHDSLLVTTFGSPEAAASFRAACVAFYAALSPSSPLHGVDVKSYAAACMVAARSRLVPDGDLGWIDCREGVAVWSPSWRGLLVVMHRAVAAQGGRVRQFCAEVVYRQEIAAGAFDVDLANRTIAHRPWYLLGLAEEPKETDVAICYASATLVDRVGYESREFRILTRHELDKREDATRDDSGEASDAWKRWRVSMMRSATTRAFMDWLPRNDELRIALDDGRGYRIAEGSPAAKLGAMIDRVAIAAESDAPRHPTPPKPVAAPPVAAQIEAAPPAAPAPNEFPIPVTLMDKVPPPLEHGPSPFQPQEDGTETPIVDPREAVEAIRRRNSRKPSETNQGEG